MITILLEKILTVLRSYISLLTDGLSIIKEKLTGIGDLIVRTCESVNSDSISYNTDISEEFVKLKVTFSPIQSGTGDPSPDNVRTISGYTGLTISQYTVLDLVKSNILTEVDWTSEASTVYAGYLDLVSGVLAITHTLVTYNGAVSENWTLQSTTDFRISAPTGTVRPDTEFAICNQAKISGAGTLPYGFFRIGGSNAIFNIGTFETLEEFKTYLSEHPLQVLYKLITPTTLQLTPEVITAIVRGNYDDTGISLKYSDTHENIIVNSIELCFYETMNNYFKNKEV